MVALVGLGLVALLILGDLTYPAVFQVEAGRILTPWRAILGLGIDTVFMSI